MWILLFASFVGGYSDTVSAQFATEEACRVAATAFIKQIEDEKGFIDRAGRYAWVCSSSG